MNNINLKDSQLVKHIQSVYTHIDQVPDEDKCNLDDESFSNYILTKKWRYLEQ